MVTGKHNEVLILMVCAVFFCCKSEDRFNPDITGKAFPPRIIVAKYDKSVDWSSSGLITVEGENGKIEFYTPIETNGYIDPASVRTIPGETDRWLYYHSWNTAPGAARLAYVSAYEEEILGTFHTNCRLGLIDNSFESPNTLYEVDTLTANTLKDYSLIHWPSWSNDGNRIAIMSPLESAGVILIDPEDEVGPVVLQIEAGWGELKFARCAPHSPSLVYVSKYPNVADNIYLINLSGGQPSQLTNFTDELTSVFSAELSPDGQVLAYSLKDKENPHAQIYLMDLRDGEPQVITPSSTNEEQMIYKQPASPLPGSLPWESEYFSWSQDGTKIAYCTWRWSTAIGSIIYMVEIK